MKVTVDQKGELDEGSVKRFRDIFPKIDVPNADPNYDFRKNLPQSGMFENAFREIVEKERKARGR